MTESLTRKTFVTLSSKHALDILQLLAERSRRYGEIHDFLYSKMTYVKGENMHAYYLRKLMEIHAIRLKKSVDKEFTFRGIYEITERGKMFLKFIKQAQIEIKLSDCKEQLTLLSNNQKSKQNHEVRAL